MRKLWSSPFTFLVWRHFTQKKRLVVYGWGEHVISGKWFQHRMLLIGELHAQVNIIVLPVSSLFRLPPPTPSPGQISQSTLREAWHGCQIARLFLDMFISASSSLVRATSIILPEALLEIHLESWTLQLGSVNNATSYFKYFCLLTKTIMPSRERYPSEATNALHCNGFLPWSTDFSRWYLLPWTRLA